MKLKKYSYLLVFFLMIALGINTVNAAEKKCYYLMEDKTSEDFKGMLELIYGEDPNGWGDYIEDYAQVRVDAAGGAENNTEPLLNWIDVDFITEADNDPHADGSPTFEWFYDSFKEVEKLSSEPECPAYLVFEIDNWWWWEHYNVWATDSLSKAKQAVTAADSSEDYTVFYARSRDDDGTLFTEEEYYSTFADLNYIDFNDWANVKLQCEDLFGDENDPDSLHSMINTVMAYIRIIVPILIILLGTVDMAKAVIAGKEDNMKKAQMDFAKRILVGVAIFFVPVIVDVIMSLAEHVWQGKYDVLCRLIK